MLSRFRAKSKGEEQGGSGSWMPPPWDIELPIGNPTAPQGYLGTWTVIGRFELRSKFPISSGSKLLDIMGAWLDSYTGSYSFHGVFTGFYILLALHSVPTKEDRTYVYSINFSERVSVTVTRKDVAEQSSDISWVHQEGSGIEWCMLKFRINLKPTKRSCTPFEVLYKKPMHTGTDPPDFEELYTRFWDLQSGYCSIII